MTPFVISFPDVHLTVDQVWPDGNAPENPTAADVVKEMEAYGSALTVADDWRLIDGLEVFDCAKRERAEYR